MKKSVIAILSLALLTSCSVKTNEEKARELIEPKVKSNLIKPESYEFAQIQLDSCFSDTENNPQLVVLGLKVAKLFKEYKEYMSEAENAESSMTIFAPSFGYQSAHEKQQHEKYKVEMEKAQRKATTAKEKILHLCKDNKKLFEDFQSAKHDFIGWAVAFGYRAETAGGLKTMGTNYCYLNKDLTEITYSFSEEDMLDVQSADLEDLQYEFEDELREIFQKE